MTIYHTLFTLSSHFFVVSIFVSPFIISISPILSAPLVAKTKASEVYNTNIVVHCYRIVFVYKRVRDIVRDIVRDRERDRERKKDICNERKGRET